MNDKELITKITDIITKTVAERHKARQERRRYDFYEHVGYLKAMNEVRSLLWERVQNAERES